MTNKRTRRRNKRRDNESKNKIVKGGVELPLKRMEKNHGTQEEEKMKGETRKKGGKGC